MRALLITSVKGITLLLTRMSLYKSDKIKLTIIFKLSDQMVNLKTEITKLPHTR